LERVQFDIAVVEFGRTKSARGGGDADMEEHGEQDSSVEEEDNEKEKS
jgi:hypothetical protein